MKRLPLPSVGLWCLLALFLLGAAGPLLAAEKKRPTGQLVSPDGRFRVQLSIGTSAEGGRVQSASVVDAKTGGEVYQLDDVGSPWIDDGSVVLWSPDSRRLAFVTPSRRGDWTEFAVLSGGKWVNADLPQMPGFKWKGHDHESKTVLASFTALRWLKPNVLLLENKVEDDNGAAAAVRFTLTFDAENHITARRATK